MARVDVNRSTLRRACELLRSGEPVVLPLPSPGPYTVVGTDAARVNVAKGRPASQPVGLTVDDVSRVAPHLDLDSERIAMTRWLCASAGISVFVPARPDPPAWLAPAVDDGTAFFTAAPWIADAAPLLVTFGALFMSSANVTRTRPAVTAAEAAVAFSDLLVLDGDPWRDPSVEHGSTTIVRLAADGSLEVARRGVNDKDHSDPADYVERLHDAWAELAAGASASSTDDTP